VPTNVYPQRVVTAEPEQGRGVQPTPIESPKPLRSPGRKFTVVLPEYVIDAIVARTIQTKPKTTSRYVILEALKALGIDVHDDDILENQLIRAAAAVLRPLVQSPSAAGQLSRLWRHISHLTPVADPLAAFERIRWTRRNGHYRPIMDLARVILAGDILEVRPGAAQVRGFTLTMHEVFETFVRRALFGGDPATGDLGIQPKTPLHLDDGKRIPLIPDLGLYSGGRWRFVGDVKYKRDADNHNDDIYQVLGYAVAADLPETTLIYAAGPQETTTHIVTSGGTRIHVHRLDLTRPPDDVLRRLREIAAATLPASRVTA